MKKINSVIYGLFGIGAILYGVTALLFPTALVPETANSFLLMHIFREEGAAAIFGGLMAFWCIFNYERSLTVHYFLTFFALLLAIIHWHDHFTGHLRWMSPIVNTVPFVVLMITAVLSRSRESAG